MAKTIEQNNIRNPQAGITMIETMLAALILVIGSVGMLSLIIDAIATNNRTQRCKYRLQSDQSAIGLLHELRYERAVHEHWSRSRRL